MKTKDELRDYKNAVWDYLLEHCDITENGALFIKFHTDGRSSFEKHVRARMVYNYHREDPRKKESVHIEKRTIFLTEKKKKKEVYKSDKQKRREMQVDIKRELARVKLVNERKQKVRKVVNAILLPFKKMLHL